MAEKKSTTNRARQRKRRTESAVEPAPFFDQSGQLRVTKTAATRLGPHGGPMANVGLASPLPPSKADLSGTVGMTHSIPAPIPITPTVYPDSPQGTVIVQNHVTINISSDELRYFNKNIEALIGELQRSNEISGEVRDQLLSELRAGKEITNAPRPQRDLIELLLVRPLKWLAEKSASAIVGKLAADALAWLLKML